jgi:uncharacterized protein
MIFRLAKTKTMKKTVLSILGILISSLVFALPEKPVGFVNDFASVLSQQEKYELENKLVEFKNRTTSEIVLVTLNSLDGMPASMAAQQLGEKWGVGGSQFNNGVVILFKPKTADSKGEVFIAAGRGLEAVIPDAIANRIIDQEMIPKFKQNDIYGGINAGLDILMSLSLKEYTAKDYEKKTSAKNKSKGIGIGIIILLFVLFNIFSSSNRTKRRSLGSGSLSSWILLSMLSSGAGRNSGSFGNFSSGGGSFGGFGGGSFGGGGAGGSW